MKPSVFRDGGESWEAAILLIAPDAATMTRESFLEKIEMIKAADLGSLVKAFESIEATSAICVVSALITTQGNKPGAGEASEIMSVAARYLDSGQVMPPEVAKWTKAWYIEMIPDFAEDWADDVQDLYNRMVLKTSPEYSVVSPPSFLNGPQSAGYRHMLYDVARSNIQAYTDINQGSPSSDEQVTGVE